MPSEIRCIGAPGRNARFMSPKRWNDTERQTCASLTVRVDGEYFSSAWKPSMEQLETLNAGGSIVLTVLGSHPAVSLGVEAAAADGRLRPEPGPPSRSGRRE
jgi:hypothetical protein